MPGQAGNDFFNVPFVFQGKEQSNCLLKFWIRSLFSFGNKCPSAFADLSQDIDVSHSGVWRRHHGKSKRLLKIDPAVCANVLQRFLAQNFRTFVKDVREWRVISGEAMNKICCLALGLLMFLSGPAPDQNATEHDGSARFVSQRRVSSFLAGVGLVAFVLANRKRRE